MKKQMSFLFTILFILAIFSSCASNSVEKTESSSKDLQEENQSVESFE